MKKQSHTSNFFNKLKKEFQKSNLPTEKVQLDLSTARVLDMDLREIKKPYLINVNEKRCVVLIGEDINTKEIVIDKLELCGFDTDPRKVIREALGRLMELGLDMEKAKTMIRFFVDFHNPIESAPTFQVDGSIF